MTLHGRKYLVAPMTMIVPGVLPGSKGPLLYPADEVATNVDNWNGMPLTNGHPVDANGNAISARKPEVLDKYGIGQVFNVQFVDNKLAGEAWFDEELTRKHNPTIIAALNASHTIELSTGLYTKDELVPNGYSHAGMPYVAIARNYRPDHLAVLTNEQGACSIKDGCGILNNATDAEKLSMFQKLGRFLGITTNSPPPSPPPTQETQSMALTANQRQEIVTILTTNCDCWKGDATTLNAFPDDKLAKLKTAYDSAVVANQVVSAVKETFGESLTVNTTSATLKEAAQKLATTPAPASPPPVPAPTANANGTVTLTTDQWTQIQNTLNDVKGVVANIKTAEETEKDQLVSRLTANVGNADVKKSMQVKFKSYPIGVLRDMASILPPTVNADPLAQFLPPNYLGAAGGPTTLITANTNDDQNDILQLPTTNWEVEAELQRRKAE